MKEVVIVDGARTPIGSFGGSLRDVPAAKLGAIAIREALRRSGVDPAEVEDTIMGCVGQVAEDAYLARAAALEAGIPATSNAMTVNRLCGSGLQAIISAAQAVRAGDVRVAVAGGAENMSRLPYYVRGARWGLRMGDTVLQDGLIAMLSDPFGSGHMGCTAENVARRYSVTREDQDRFALESQRRAAAAIARGEFKDEIVPVPVPDRGGERLFDRDEHPRETSLEKLAALKPVFQEGGTVTAGNSSGINDAGAAVVVMDGDEAVRRGLKPKARFVGWAMAGVEPAYMGYAPAYAIPRVLEKTGLRLEDIDVVELNEAFAAQAVAVIRDAGLDPARTNPNGGAIALGHPVGATACILTIKAIEYLRRHGKRYALVTMCIGGGQALAAVFERL
ncbi:MAG: acetyl-CoA C-acyltransferase [Firmicutes bacterium]|nr:acetyl-CoA C-acyltransferase [Bacillota bacterium]